MNKKTIGVGTLGYPEIRNISSLKFSNYDVKKFQNLYKIPAYLIHKFKGEINFYYWYSFRDLDFGKYDVLHLFNGISFGNKPWVSTFETYLPRWHSKDPRVMKKGLDLICKDSCKALIAMSVNAQNIQRLYLEEFFPDYVDRVMEKVQVIYPAQKLLIDSMDEKNLSKDKIEFVFVGNQFFKKGGREVLDVFEEFSKNHNLKLHLISNLSPDWDVTDTTQKDVEEIKKRIENSGDWLSHHSNLSNDNVLQFLKNSHVALMPTYADTFGYFVLEAQASGCPVITTNIRALTEINNDDFGWTIKVPQDKYKNSISDTIENRKALSEIISAGLRTSLNEIFDNPELIKEKAELALQRITISHDPVQAAKKMEADVYGNL